MTRDEVLLLLAVVAPGKFPAADAYFAREIDLLLKDLLAKREGKLSNGR